MYALALTTAKTLLSQPTRQGLRKRLRRFRRPAWLGTLRRTTPLSNNWGSDRGTPVDRYYIEHFLKDHRGDIRGRVIEVKNSQYTERFGIDIERREVLDINPHNPEATIHADLAAAHSIPSDSFDCFILTQTLQFIYEPRAALAHARRVLRSGGAILATVPSIIRMDCELDDIDYWRFTVPSCRSLFGEIFGADRIVIHAYGNVLASTAFLNGMAAEELHRNELDAPDSRFPVVIGVRAVKT